MIGADARERSHWGLRWCSLSGHEACERCAEMIEAGACEHRQWSLRRSSQATKRVRGVPKWVRRAPATVAAGAFGAPSWATKRVRGVPKWVRRARA
eukprot:5275833-Pyramimonas_sp.AAC.1